MLLHGIVLDRGSRISLRRQLVGHLESRILGGQIEPGRRLPSVRRAEELLGLHRNTIAAAYRDLVQAGIARARPGAGVYAKPPDTSSDAAFAAVRVIGPRDVALRCSDQELRAVLEAELRAHLAVGVVTSDFEGAGIPIHLAPHAGFLRVVHSLTRPALVSVVSGSEYVHRLVAATTLIHGGEGIAYLPVSAGRCDQLGRAARLGSTILADHASLWWARSRARVEVPALALISASTVTQLGLPRRHRTARRKARFPADARVERSLQRGVKEP
jgi:DNA-binding transcriptional regulator YhcF (GntR family)